MPSSLRTHERDGRRQMIADWLDRHFRLACVLLVLFAAALRGGYVLTHHQQLSEDRDAYLAIGQNWAATGQYGVGRPTAFRPPLYPLVVAACDMMAHATPLPADGLRGGANVVFACGAVALVAIVGRDLAGSAVGLFAGLLVAISPLAIRYTAFSMTETLSVLLMTAVVERSFQLTRSDAWPNWTTWGAVVGLAALCRPTVWVAAALLLVAVLVANRRNGVRRVLLAGTMSLVVASPWVVRNAVVFGKPILLTTHGGYTLALGNNDGFYDDVVGQPWGTVWTTGQQAWIARTQAEIASRNLTSEPDSDRYYKTLAYATIRDRPGKFVESCWLRLRRFFSPVPTTSGGFGKTTVILVGCFYVAAYLMAIAGAFRITGVDRLLLVVPVAAFAAVHLFYWSNARMRLPVEPCLFLLAAIGVFGTESKPNGRDRLEADE